MKKASKVLFFWCRYQSGQEWNQSKDSQNLWRSIGNCPFPINSTTKKLLKNSNRNKITIMNQRNSRRMFPWYLPQPILKDLNTTKALKNTKKSHLLLNKKYWKTKKWNKKANYSLPLIKSIPRTRKRVLVLTALQKRWKV